MSLPLASPKFSPTAIRGRPLRIGFISLTDAAPFIVAQELGHFEKHDLRVELRREIGWATIREKIIYGELDAAQALAPMLWSTQLGLGCPPCDVLTAFVASVHGNAITLSRALWDAGVRDAATLRDHVRARRPRPPLTLGVVFHYSSHHLLLRDWLRSAGLDPERDVRIVVVPPAQMVRNLTARTLDGFCSGEPWNSVAIRQGIGWSPACSAVLQPAHIEKVLMVTQRFAESRPEEHAALVRALSEAAAWCDAPQNRGQVAELLGDARYLNLQPNIVAPALLGEFDCGNGRIERVPRFHVFQEGNANVPAVAKAAALQRELGAAGLLPTIDWTHDSSLPRRLFREDLHREFLTSAPSLHDDVTSPDLRGVASHHG